MKPVLSRLISGGSQPVFGCKPMNTNIPFGWIASVAFFDLSKIVTPVNFASPCSSLTSVL